MQFVKGRWQTGERAALEKFGDQVTITTMGEGFTWETQDRARDICRRTGRMGKGKGADRGRGAPDGGARRAQHRAPLRLPATLAEVVAALTVRPPMKHVVVTGRNARDELIEVADLVTEMEQIKHPFRSGVKAQKGIEF